MDKIKEKIIEYSKNKNYVVGAVIIFIVLVLLVVLNMSTPKKTVKEFFKALENGDDTKVSELIYVNRKAIEEEFGEDEMDDYDEDELSEKLIEEYDEEDIDYEIISVKERTKTAIVKVDIDGEEVKYYLKKIDGKWKIDLYKSVYESMYNAKKTIRMKKIDKATTYDDYDY